MTTETQVTEATTPAAPEAKTLSSPDITFAEYQTLRRGGELPKETASAPEAKADEQKKTVASDATETEETEKEKPENEGAGDESEKSDTAANLEDSETKPGKKKSGFQKRIDKLNSAKAEAQREAEYWKNLALEAKGKTETKTEAKAEPKHATTDGKPKPESFDTHAEYVEALTDWKTEQKLNQREEKAEKARAEAEWSKKVQTYLTKKSEFADKTPDFDEALAEVEDITVSPAVSQLIIDSEHGPELAYALAKDRETYARICKLPPLAAAREMGKLEAKIVSRASEAKETKKVTSAPQPLSPVGTGKGSARKSINDPDLSFADYVRMRRDQIRHKGA